MLILFGWLRPVQQDWRKGSVHDSSGKRLPYAALVNEEGIEAEKGASVSRRQCSSLVPASLRKLGDSDGHYSTPHWGKGFEPVFPPLVNKSVRFSYDQSAASTPGSCRLGHFGPGWGLWYGEHPALVTVSTQLHSVATELSTYACHL